MVEPRRDECEFVHMLVAALRNLHVDRVVGYHRRSSLVRASSGVSDSSWARSGRGGDMPFVGKYHRLKVRVYSTHDYYVPPRPKIDLRY